MIRFLEHLIQRERKNGNIFLSQEKYVEKVLESFVIDNVNLVTVPFACHFKLYSGLSPKNDEYKRYTSCVPYEYEV